MTDTVDPAGGRAGTVRKGASKRNARTGHFGYLGVLVLLMVVGACSPDEQEAPAADAQQTAATQTAAEAPAEQAPAEKRGLEMDRSTFVERWNEVSEAPIPMFEWGKENSAQLDLGHAQVLTLGGDGEGKIHNLNLVMGSTEEKDDVVHFLLNLVAIVAALEPGLTPDQRGQVIKDLKLVGDEMDFDTRDEDGSRVAIAGNTAFTYMLFPGRGILVAATPAN